MSEHMPIRGVGKAVPGQGPRESLREIVPDRGAEITTPGVALPADARAHEAAAKPAEAPIGNWLSVVSHLDPKYGGLSSVVPHLASLLTNSGRFHVQVEAFCLPSEHSKPAGYSDLQVSFWPTSRLTWLRNRSFSRMFRRDIAQCDGVHIHGLWEQSTLAAVRGARTLAKPYILSAHGMLEPWALGSKRLKKGLYAAMFERAHLQNAACLHALTAAEARNYRDFGCRGPIAVIPNGVDVPSTLSPDLFLEAFPALRGKRAVLFLGRLHKKKGVDLLLRAWARVAPLFPDACLVLAGPAEPARAAELEKLAFRLGISEQVLFTGMLDYPMKWSALASAECFVLPSYSEGLSVATLEAMGAGVPVIVTENCNLPEVAEYGAGWQIAPRLKELVVALERCLSSSGTANRELGKRGAALVRERYSWPTVAAQMAELYTWVQSGTPASSKPKSFAVEMH